MEPQPKLAIYLKKVLPKDVTVLNLALSDHAGTAQMLIPKVKGLGHTILDVTTLKNSTAKSKINSLKKILSADISFFELRVTEKARVHGFKVNETFHLVFLDKGHQVCPM